ncbi:Ig-like domain-containing protein [Shewanella frigidimarina]
MMAQSAWAVTPADENYDKLLIGDQGTNAVTINGITYTSGVAHSVANDPTIAGANYNALKGILAVTGTNFTATTGATNDVDASKFTIMGDVGDTYTLTDTADVEISSATSFTLTLSATDRAGVNVIINQNASVSTGGTLYNLAGAAGFIADASAVADLTGNHILAESVPIPVINYATYNASAGELTVTGTGFTKLGGAANDIIANKFTLLGEEGLHTLTDTSNVEITSGTSFTLNLSETDKAAYNLIANQNGSKSTNTSTYQFVAADDWAAGAEPTLDVRDDSGNTITVSGVAIPTITSATYNFSTGVLGVTGNGYLRRWGATNDVIANKFTVTGESDATYTLTNTANVEVTSGTNFTLALSATDKTAVNSLLNNNGISSQDSTTYNLAAAEDWAAGANAAVNVADVTGNRITVSNVATVAGAPTIGTATAGDTQLSVSFSAPSSNGGSAITTYTATTSPGDVAASGAGSPLTITGLTNGVAYTVTVTATNSAGISPASAVSNSAVPTAPKAAQTITFNNPGAQNFGSTPTLSATADSGLTPVFTSATTGVCTISSGGALSFVAAGTCTIDANETGNSSYLPATQVSQSFSVNAVVAGAPTIGIATAGDAQASVSFTAPTNTGGAAITAYTVTSSPGGLTASGAGSPLTVIGLTNGTAYTFSVTATSSLGTSIASSMSNSVTPKSAQTITFVNPGTQNISSTLTLIASASSGLTPVFTSSSSNVCTVTSGGGVTFITTGSCIINANQTGNGIYLSAGQVSQTFTVSASLAGAPSIGSATAGDTQASVSFSAPANNGGAAITAYTATSSPGGFTSSGAASPLSITGLTNGTAYTFSVTATNIAGTSIASAASNSVVPLSANSAPVGTNISVSLDEDTSVSFSFTATDAENDVLSFEVLTQPTSGTLDKHGSVWLYTPDADFNGDDSVSFIAKDAELSSQPGLVSITVNSINDEPKAVDDTYSQSASTDNSYTIAVLDNDTDVDGDTLTIDGAAADVGNVQVVASQLIYQAPANFIGPVALRYSISDGQKGRSNAKVKLLITGEISADAPVITVPDDITANATGLFTKIKLGVAKAVDKAGNKLAVSLVNTQQFFAPGEHLAYWQATDNEGRSTIKSQKVTVHPLISISRNQVVAEGQQVQLRVFLNGYSAQYPVSIPYTVSGSSDENDHDLVDGVFEITSGLSANFSLNIFEDGVKEADEELVISLDPSLNLSGQHETRLLLTEANIAPQASIKVTQSNELRTQVSKQEGNVFITTKSYDKNQQDNLTEVWSTGALVLESDVDGSYFDPSTLEVGRYPISLVVTDDGEPQLSTTVQLTLLVQDSLPILTGDDSDGDLIPDDQEGFTDTDNDGIADYLDAINECNVLQEQSNEQSLFLVESQPGVCLRLGNTAQLNGSDGIEVQKDDLIDDLQVDNIGGLFNFELTDLPKQGDSVTVVIPQTLPAPTNAVYRKFIRGSWQDFVSNANNSVMSSAGSSGYCPPPGATEWQEGLTEGHWCVQLTIEDGGPNDDDGIANGTIVDPGGVAVMLNGNALPLAVADAVTVPVNQGIEIDVLANDSDTDGDTLTVKQVISQFGTAEVLDNQQISYLPAEDFIGTDVLVYSISDGNGGTGSSKLTVTVVANRAPIAVDDMASTDDKTTLILDVLSNDTDADNQTLSVIAVSAQQGSVMIENNKIRYTPITGFEGVDTVSYTISDGEGGEATANVMVTVKAYQTQVVENESSGGSMHWLWSGLLLLVIMLRIKPESGFKYYKVLSLGLVVLLANSSHVQAQGASSVSPWYLDAVVGFSESVNTQAEFQRGIPTGQIEAFDKSDTSFGFSIGYQVNSVLAFELGYIDFGEGSTQISGESLNTDQYHELLKSVSPILPTGFNVGVDLSLVKHDGWRFSVPVGVLVWESEVKSYSQGQTLTNQFDGIDWYTGMHLDYQFTHNWSAGLGIDYIALAPNDILSYQLNLRYQF